MPNLVLVAPVLLFLSLCLSLFLSSLSFLWSAFKHPNCLAQFMQYIEYITCMAHTDWLCCWQQSESHMWNTLDDKSLSLSFFLFSCSCSPPFLLLFLLLLVPVSPVIASLAHCFSSGIARLHADVVVIIIVEVVELFGRYSVQEREYFRRACKIDISSVAQAFKYQARTCCKMQQYKVFTWLREGLLLITGISRFSMRITYTFVHNIHCE